MCHTLRELFAPTVIPGGRRPADAQGGWQRDMYLAGAYIRKAVQCERGLMRDGAAHLGTAHPTTRFHVNNIMSLNIIDNVHGHCRAVGRCGEFIPA